MEFEVTFGGSGAFRFENQAHGEALAQALRLQLKKLLELNELLRWRLPVQPAGAQSLLQMLRADRRKLAALKRKIEELETRLNELVYSAYGLSRAEKQVVEGFLERFSSQAADEEGKGYEETVGLE